MKGWEKAALGDLCEVNIGRTPARERSDFWGEGHDWLSIADMNQGRNLLTTKEKITDLAVQQCGYRAAPTGTVLLSFKLSIGKVGIAGTPLFTNEAIAALPIRDKALLEANYLYWALQSIDLTLGLDRAAKGLILNKAKLLGVKIPLPPLTKQRRIAEVLDRAEALRAKRRAALAQLDALTQSIFLDLFGDPVGNDRNWPIQTVGDFVAGFESGKSIVSDDEDDTASPYRVLKVSAVTSLDYKPEQNKALPPDYKPPASHVVCMGDLLFSRANTSELIGATAYVFSTPPNLLLPDKLWRFVWHQEPRADPHFVRYLFRQSKFRREMGQRASGTSGSMKNISQNKVMTIRTGLPPLSLQREFTRRVTAVEKLKAAQRASLAELDALFSSLQHRAFRGEL